MRPLYRNLFFALGIAAVWLMVRNLDVTWAEAATAARRAGIWLPACLLLWLVIYLMNAWAWSLIIRSGEQEQQERSVGFWRIMKYTVTGYALNYVTPAGVLGGEPYRIMELRPFLGTERAVSCVLLNSMMHIFTSPALPGCRPVCCCSVRCSWQRASLSLSEPIARVWQRRVWHGLPTCLWWASGLQDGCKRTARHSAP